MAHLSWRKHQESFHILVDELTSGVESDARLLSRVQEICKDDQARDQTILGVASPHLAFLEYLFYCAEGPYNPLFQKYAPIIRILFQASIPLTALLNLNAADAIGNMILNKRGRLKFAIADNLELVLLLEWWPRFGLQPVNEREIFDAVCKKSTISYRISSQDPCLLLRLSEVFPSYPDEFLHPGTTREDLIASCSASTPPPSYRRFRRLYHRLLDEGFDIREIIRIEENRVLPMQMRRNTFLSYLVKQLHGETCQICASGSPVTDPLITVHHIVPLVEGGLDTARNMLVVCNTHHQAIHAGEIQVRISDTIEVLSQSDRFLIEPNP
ncbi:MAG: HNH endonuclease [Methanospirillum sp.]|uniref:HNH endonuclease signature motif containing protein n=1 Tax=Methanospirillum sp. TaxID=45200 RepID=UPI00236BF246|nr:HNH endonuclease [Methanospirillum sp.]MDD1728402.1 HNH endonuclease [Methanospirillum sp.]